MHAVPVSHTLRVKQADQPIAAPTEESARKARFGLQSKVRSNEPFLLSQCCHLMCERCIIEVQLCDAVKLWETFTHWIKQNECIVTHPG
jgi:hypothetical protein